SIRAPRTCSPSTSDNRSGSITRWRGSAWWPPCCCLPSGCIDCCCIRSRSRPGRGLPFPPNDPMNEHAVAVTGFVVLFVLMLLRVPVGIAMGLVGIVGFGYLNQDWGSAMSLLAQSPIRTVADVQFAVIPLFLLMGAFASSSGMSRELFRASNAFVGHFKGGLGIATIAACGGF